MVMHARKIARVNDGVYERSQARPYENTEKYPSKGSNYNDRCNIELSRESPMYHRQRDDSPGNRGPRYINKTAYNDNRTKDKFERMPSMSPADKKLNHNSSSGYHGDRSDGDRHNNNDRDHQADKPVLQNNSNEWSEHISSSGKKYYYNSRTEVSQWERPPEYAEKIPVIESRQRDKDFRKQVDKNMSYSNRAVQEDRKHSSGLDSRFDGAKPSFSSASSSSSFPRYTDKHSTNQQTYDRWKTVQNRYPSTSNYVDSTAGGSGTTSVDSYQRTKMSLPQHTWPGSDVAHRDGFVYGRQDNMPAVSRSYSEISDYRTRRNASYSQGVHGVGNTSVGFSQNGAKPVDSLRSENEDSRLMEDMDISPGSTPTNSPRLARPQSRSVGGMGHIASSSTSVYSYSSTSISNATTGSSYLSVSGSTPRSTGVTPTKTLPQLISQLGDKALQRIDSQELTQQAIQTLQQLQHLTSALSRQAQNAAASQSPKSDMTSPFPQQSPQVNSHIVTPSSSSGSNSAPAATASHHNHHHHHHPHKAGRDQTTPTSTPPTTLHTQQHQPHPAHVSHKDDSKYDGRDSPNSEVSHRSSERGSPTPSQSSSQGVPSSAPPGGGITAPAPAPGKPATIQITPSLANCYNEKSIAHVLGWPGIHTERQANRYSEEAHTVGSLHCTQVSADLKKARSLVRVAEIQATLQEQRVLFLQQQIKDLENLKSQNTFMPSPEDKGLSRRPRASESHSDNQHNAT